MSTTEHIFHISNLRSIPVFNGLIEDWDVSKVTNMTSMFCFAKSFNQDIREWNTNNVTKMDCMFKSAESFNLENAPWFHE